MLSFILLGLLSSAQAQPPGVSIIAVQPYGFSGSVTGAASPTVNGQPTRVLFYIFIPDLGWYAKPNCSPIAVQPDGAWTAFTSGAGDSYATRFVAYLVPATFTPICVLGPAEIPAAIEQAALAKASRYRPNPRPVTLRFSGLDWIVKAPPARVFPGPNFFTESPDVDTQGRLHLYLRRCGNPIGNLYCSSEVYSKDALGYGTYRITLESPVASLDPNAVFGMFTWSENGASHNRELDFEFSRWGNAADTNNAQFVVQPYTIPNHLSRYRMPDTSSSLHVMRWLPGEVSFQSFAGPDANAPQVSQLNVTGAGVPPVGDAQFHFNLYLNGGQPPTADREIEVVISKFEYVPSGDTVYLLPTLAEVPISGGIGTVFVSAPLGCSWTATPFPEWLSIVVVSGHGNGFIWYQSSSNESVARSGGLRISSSNCSTVPGAQEIRINQAGSACTYSLNSYSQLVGPEQALVGTNLNTNDSSCPWIAISSAAWISFENPLPPTGSAPISLRIAANTSTTQRTGTVTIAGRTFTVTQRGTNPPQGLMFVPLQPCRIADTRVGSGPFGTPALTGGVRRDFPIPSSSCQVPDDARAFSLNVTAVPRGPLPYVTIWPAGEPQPLVSTLNSFDGAIVANAAIVPAGANGAISTYAAAATDLVLDINGYFIPNGSLTFQPLETPCRLMDTRPQSGSTGPFGAPSFTTASPFREVPVLQSGCPISPQARAYALNITVVPRGSLAFLTAYPSGESRPLVSTLNSFEGRVLANAAIVPAGNNSSGSISFYTSLAPNAEVDLVVDITGYFGAGLPGGMRFFPVSPCRVVDTRVDLPGFGLPAPISGQERGFSVPYGPCSVPSAPAYSLNTTVVPHAGLNFLTLWPGGTTRPLASTLNSFDGRVVANAAIVRASSSWIVNSFASLAQPGSTADLILDINGYFAP